MAPAPAAAPAASAVVVLVDGVLSVERLQGRTVQHFFGRSLPVVFGRVRLVSL